METLKDNLSNVKSILNNQDLDNSSEETITSKENSLEELQSEKSPSETNSDDKSNTSDEQNESNNSVDISTEDANTTNCLALTIQKDHKLIAVKNVFFKSIRMTWKVVVSTITLWIIKLLS